MCCTFYVHHFYTGTFHCTSTSNMSNNSTSLLFCESCETPVDSERWAVNSGCVFPPQVKVDLVGLAQECCPDLDLKAELERSFQSEPSSPGHTKAPKGFRLGKHKHETFITSRY